MNENFENEVCRWDENTSIKKINNDLAGYLESTPKIHDGEYFVLGYHPVIRQPGDFDHKGPWLKLRAGYFLEHDEDNDDLVLFYDMELYKKYWRYSSPCPGCQICQKPIAQRESFGSF